MEIQNKIYVRSILVVYEPHVMTSVVTWTPPPHTRQSIEFVRLA
jgi:hypothetical protein